MNSPAPFADSASVMRHALAIAARGIGRVEPNPPVGAVLVDENLRLLGAGYHEGFGGPHAEVNAIRHARDSARGATLFVTLEPCAHHGKTPPCSQAVIQAGISRVVIAMRDPSPHADGKGIAELEAAGIPVEVGLLEEESRALTAPFVKRVTTGRPWVHLKWAMTLDGKIASRTGHSQWISNEASRRVVHELRGRMDAVIVGANTARMDDPRLTARPAGLRTPARVVIDSRATLSPDSQLVRTIDHAPLLVACTELAPDENVERLQSAGAEVLTLSISHEGGTDLDALLREFGKREMTNILVEGGGALAGALFDAGLVDELHVFIATKLVGGNDAISPLGGVGLETIPELSQLQHPTIDILDGDIYVHGRL
jgi:diaminohydroxyphosphoribosylaminopyrimidine deaminase/5-amino-6-(5-phosphoribosylamino)uracil reductase